MSLLVQVGVRFSRVLGGSEIKFDDARSEGKTTGLARIGDCIGTRVGLYHIEPQCLLVRTLGWGPQVQRG